MSCAARALGLALLAAASGAPAAQALQAVQAVQAPEAAQATPNADARAAPKADALRERARAATDLADRRAAIAALLALPEPASVDALFALLADLPAADQPLAARALALKAGARTALVAWVQRAEAEPQAVAAIASEARAELLAAYGARLAETLAQPPSAAELAPLARGQSGADLRLRVAASRALDGFVRRLVELDRVELAQQALALAPAAGIDPLQSSWRLAVLSLSEAADPAPALAAARELERVGAQRAGLDRLWWRLHAHYLAGMARIAAGRADLAGDEFEAARAQWRELAAAREDVRPDPVLVEDRALDAQADRVEAGARIELGELLRALALGRGAQDPELLELARRVHLRSLETHALDTACADPSGRSGFDSLLDGELAPRRLLLSNERRPATCGRANLDLLDGLLRALGAVAPFEIPGYATPPGGELPGHATPPAAAALPAALGDPRRDPERLALLQRVLDARIDGCDRRVGLLRAREEYDHGETVLWTLIKQSLSRDRAEAEERDWVPLLEQRDPSTAQLDQAALLRRDGRAADAEALCRRALDDLDRQNLLGRFARADWHRARLEQQLGSALTDLARPAEAEQMLLGAEKRLVALENATRAQAAGSSRNDQQDSTVLSAQLRALRSYRAAVLVSLAVNANVRLKDQPRALGYFERAWELDPGEGMDVILACYRARSGRFEEARALLSEVLEEPQNDYNLACTYALLGERDKALEILRRELGENLRSAGARARQRAWAREDPDLAQLRGDARFEALLAEPDQVSR